MSKLLESLYEESKELKLKLDNLCSFLQSDKAGDVTVHHLVLLVEQHDAMNWYYTLLLSRIEDLEDESK